MSEATPDTGDQTTPDKGTDTNEPDTGNDGDLRKEIDKWKTAARKHEDRAKANAKAAQELNELRRQSMDEAEKAIADARADERLKVAREYATRLVDSELRTAAAGRGIDVDALIEGIDRDRFITDDAEPNREAIVSWLDKVAPLPTDDATVTTTIVPMLDLGQGSRGAMPLNGDPLEKMLKQTLGIR